MAVAIGVRSAPAGGDTTRSTYTTAPAHARTVCLIGLAVPCPAADSAAIEDIPSTTNPEETHHERNL